MEKRLLYTVYNYALLLSILSPQGKSSKSLGKIGTIFDSWRFIEFVKYFLTRQGGDAIR